MRCRGIVKRIVGEIGVASGGRLDREGLYLFGCYGIRSMPTTFKNGILDVYTTFKNGIRSMPTTLHRSMYTTLMR